MLLRLCSPSTPTASRPHGTAPNTRHELLSLLWSRSMYCQKCRTPLRLDGSLEDLNPAAFDLLVGIQALFESSSSNTKELQVLRESPFPKSLITPHLNAHPTLKTARNSTIESPPMLPRQCTRDRSLPQIMAGESRLARRHNRERRQRATQICPS